MAINLSGSYFEMGVRAHQQGQAETAEEHYRQALAIDPNHIEALHCAGVLALQAGAPETAVQRLRRAVELGVTAAGTHFLLGRAYKLTGDVDRAIDNYRQALAHDPELVDAYVSLGIALKQRGDVSAAAEAYRAALARRPDSFEAQLNLANLLQLQGEWLSALDRYDRVLAAAPQSAEAHYNRGVVLRALGHNDQAIASFRQACLLDPAHLEAQYNFATALLEAGHHDVALACLNNTRGALERGEGRITADRSRDALYLATLTNLAAAALHCVDFDTAFAMAQYVIEFEPANRAAFEVWLTTLPYRNDDRAIVEHAFARYRNLLEPFDLPAVASPATGAEKATLRVGLMSGDFRDHSVVFFLEPWLAQHDRNAFEIFCYSTNKSSDEVTDRVRDYVAGWADATEWDDHELADRIVADGIDILIDLSGRTHYNRLGVLLLQAAPLQLAYLGYPTYTGTWKVAYRVTDAVIDPDDRGPDYERPLRLPRSMFCYRPPHDAPDVGPLPALRRDAVCFGSFNQLQKLSPDTLAAWAKILLAVPRSTLLLKCKDFRREDARARVIDALKQTGVAPERVRIEQGFPDRRAHLAMYDEIDIALDTFPYNGVTTTCEALWMGVPVVTRVGETHAARSGASLLGALGLDEWIAASADEYVEIAVARAQDVASLAVMRGELRPRFAASMLRDEAGFARDFESTLRSAWRRAASVEVT